MTIDEVAKVVLTYRMLFPQFYSRPSTVLSIANQAYYCSKESFSHKKCEIAAHIVMKKLAATGSKFIKDGKLYNPFSKTIMSDVPKKWTALGALIK